MGYFTTRSVGKPYRYLTLLLVAVFLLEGSTRVTARVIQSSYPVYYITMVVLMILYGKIYAALLPDTKLYKALTRFVPMAFAAVVITATISTSSYFSWPGKELIVLSLLLVFFSLLLYLHMLHNPSEVSLFKQPVFWFNTGTFLFYSISFFSLTFKELLIPDTLAGYLSEYIIVFSGAFIYLLYGVAIYLEGYEKHPVYKSA